MLKISKCIDHPLSRERLIDIAKTSLEQGFSPLISSDGKRAEFKSSGGLSVIYSASESVRLLLYPSSGFSGMSIDAGKKYLSEIETCVKLGEEIKKIQKSDSLNFRS